MPPDRSPLAILTHEFTTIELRAEISEEPVGKLNLTTAVSFGTNPENELERACELTVEFGPVDKDQPASYSGKISVVGSFRISENYPEDRRDQLMKVSASSILYGCLPRDAGQPHGKVGSWASLSSLSFLFRGKFYEAENHSTIRYESKKKSFLKFSASIPYDNGVLCILTVRI